MDKLGGAVRELSRIDENLKNQTWLVRLHPLVKLLVSVLYIAMTVSVPVLNIGMLLLMAVYPVVLFITGDVSFRDSLRRLKVVLPLVCFVGVLNPFFDKTPVMLAEGLMVTGGVISMVTLMVKGVLTVLAAYLLIATTGIERICYALRQLHVPQLIVTQILLTYRYISLLLTEMKKTVDAYKLRAPGQRGIHIRAWGSLVGGLLLRSIDRANVLYESMILRGFHGEFYYSGAGKAETADYIYLIAWTVCFIVIRLFGGRI
ncbi:MAG: cobalt ECF transporter T component CbiQ [Eubacteriales bacterium]|nr:cobalt ECF transporter T component CbiQ [Eubacteriales bacterium]